MRNSNCAMFALEPPSLQRFLQEFLLAPQESDIRKILVCTDRASRGVDSAFVEHVVCSAATLCDLSKWSRNAWLALLCDDFDDDDDDGDGGGWWEGEEEWVGETKTTLWLYVFVLPTDEQGNWQRRFICIARAVSPARELADLSMFMLKTSTFTPP